MTCENYQEWISAEMDMELDGVHESALWLHLADCEVCRLWRRDQQLMRHDFQRWPEELLPNTVKLPDPKQVERKLRSYRIPRSWAWAAGIVILLQGTYLFTNTLYPPAPSLNGDDAEVETIELTDDDLTSHQIQQFQPGDTEDGSDGG